MVGLCRWWVNSAQKGLKQSSHPGNCNGQNIILPHLEGEANMNTYEVYVERAMVKYISCDFNLGAQGDGCWHCVAHMGRRWNESASYREMKTIAVDCFSLDVWYYGNTVIAR